MNIHIGKILAEHLDAKRISHPQFARMIGKHPNGMWRLFLRQHLHTTLLLKISQQLNYNFFQYYVTNTQQENKKLDELQQQNLLLQKENERLNIENNLLKEMFAMRKGGEK